MFLVRGGRVRDLFLVFVTWLIAGAFDCAAVQNVLRPFLLRASSVLSNHVHYSN